MDPRTWDLHQLLAAYEVTLRQGAKDDASWQRVHAQIHAEPREVRSERVAGGREAARQATPSGGMSMSQAQALLAGMAAEDSMYGRG